MTTEIKLMNCRLVGGHPMKRNPVTDKHGQPVKEADGVTPKTGCYIGIAVPKTPGVDWKQEPWGQEIVTAALAGYPNGETGAPTFAWKITDGDSAVPNRKQRIPNQREGYPGHWVLAGSTQFFIKCFHKDKYDPMEQIQNPAEIKPGDYCMVLLSVKDNKPKTNTGADHTPGVYLNPSIFVLSRPGEEIILDTSTTAAQAFGGGAPSNPAPQPNAPAPQTGNPVAPNPEFLNGPPAPDVPTPPPVEQFNVNGQIYTRDQLTQAGWTPEQIAQASKV